MAEHTIAQLPEPDPAMGQWWTLACSCEDGSGNGTILGTSQIDALNMWADHVAMQHDSAARRVMSVIRQRNVAGLYDTRAGRELIDATEALVKSIDPPLF